MRRALFLSYYFPPLGGAGVQRTVKFVKHLPELGWDSAVVTGPTRTTVAWAPVDATLAQEVPYGTLVRRIAAPPPPPGAAWRRRATRWLRVPSAFSRWWVEGATEAGRAVVGDADVIVASMSPFETAEAARRLARAGGVPWIADLRDPWALDEWLAYPTGIHRRLEEHRMHGLLRDADGIVLNTPEAASAVLARFPELSRRALATIPNGWDADDFRDAPPRRTDAAFRIVYSGYAHTTARRGRGALGGATPGLETTARSHLYLLEALERLAGSRPELRERIELHIAGPAPAREVEGRVQVHDHGYLDHADAIALVRSADLLFLPMHDLPPGIRTRTVPGKTYEYLAAGRPILAALPDGDARDMLARLERVRLCRPRAVDCLANALAEATAVPRAPDVPVTPELMRYERRALAGDLVRFFDDVLSRHTSRKPPRRRKLG